MFDFFFNNEVIPPRWMFRVRTVPGAIGMPWEDLFDTNGMFVVDRDLALATLELFANNLTQRRGELRAALVLRNAAVRPGGRNRVQVQFDAVATTAAIGVDLAKKKEYNYEKDLVAQLMHLPSRASNPKEYRAKMKPSLSPQKFPHDHCVGVEIEIENVQMHPEPVRQTRLMEMWHTKPDGSLRNGGIEFVSVYGATAADVMTYLPVLHAAMVTSEVSFRCGLHIHVDVTQFTMPELYRVFMVYTIMEKILFAVSGQRGENRFCRPVQDSVTSVANCMHYGHASDWSKFIDAACHGTKYLAMNVRTLGQFGTLEFRHHHGTIDSTQLGQWLTILLDMVLVAKAATTEELEKKIKNLNTESQYEAFINSFFPNSRKALLVKEFAAKMYDGVAFVKECWAAEPEKIVSIERIQ